MKHDVASFAIQARQLLLPLQPLSPFVFSIFDEGLLLVQLQSAQHTSIGTRVLLYSPFVGGAIGLVFTLQGIVRTCLRYATAHKLLAVRDIHCSTDSMQMCIFTIAHICSMHVAVCRGSAGLYPKPCILSTLYCQSHGPSALRFPVRRSNSERFLGAFVASQFTGMIFTIFIAASMGVVLAFLLEDWPGSSALKSVRLLVSHAWHS